jgi:hypothetical protein
MWLTAMSIHTPAVNIRADLKIDGCGPPASVPAAPEPASRTWLWVVVSVSLMGLAVWAANLGRPAPRPA